MTDATQGNPGWRWKAGCLLAGTVLIVGLMFAIRVLPIWVWGVLLLLLVIWVHLTDRGSQRSGRRLRSLAAPWPEGQRLAICVDVLYPREERRREIDVLLRKDGGRVHTRERMADGLHDERSLELEAGVADAAWRRLEELAVLKMPSRIKRGRFDRSAIVDLTDGRKRHAFRCVPLEDGVQADVVRALEALI